MHASPSVLSSFNRTHSPRSSHPHSARAITSGRQFPCRIFWIAISSINARSVGKKALTDRPTNSVSDSACAVQSISYNSGPVADLVPRKNNSFLAMDNIAQTPFSSMAARQIEAMGVSFPRRPLPSYNNVPSLNWYPHVHGKTGRC